MATRTILIEGVAKRYVRDLRIGDRVDLEADTFADPAHDPHSPFQFEFEVVAGVERETDDCTRVDFESGFSCGFPPDHLVDVDGEQPEEGGEHAMITDFEQIGDDLQPCASTDAYGGCYLDRRDFDQREQIGPDLWRLYDHEDEGIPAAGPLYQYADAAMIERLQAFFYPEGGA